MTQSQTDKLYDHHRQQLSAMLDGELAPDQAKFMLRRLQHDVELAACWERWQVCGDVLRGRHEAPLPADFSQRVMRALAVDAALIEAADQDSGPSTATKPRWPFARLRVSGRWAGSAALAASVAVVALFIGRQTAHTDPAAMPTPVHVADNAPAPATAPVPVPQSLSAPEPAAPDNAPAAAGPAAAVATVVAAAGVPVRLAETRRSRGQSQRAALRARRQSEVPIRVARADAPVRRQPLSERPPAPSLLAATPAAPTAADPFATHAHARARPWPRAILPDFPARGALTASYGDSSAQSFHPFEPQVELAEPDADTPSRNSGPR